MEETEIRTQITEDIERLKDDILEFIKERKKHKYEDYVSGIRCPKCNNCNSTIYDSRSKNEFKIRSRKCNICGKKWRTVEVIHY